MQTSLSSIDLQFEPFNLTIAHPFGISYGSSTVSENVLVRLSFENFHGIGESSPAEYHNESPETVLALLARWKSKKLFGSDPFAIVDTMNRLDRDVAGNAAAKAAIEMALHDLCGKIAGLPTYKMLGLAGLRAPVTDLTIGLASLEMIEKKTKDALAFGHKALKIKQGTRDDREIIKAVRKVSKDIPLRVDANGAWTVKQAIEMSHFLAENGVEFIEQPLPKTASYADFKMVREHSALPIFADESIAKAYDVARLAGAIDGVVVKLAKTGGLLEAMRVISTARAHGMQVMLGCMMESSIGITAAAQLCGLADHLDLDSGMLLAEDPYEGARFEDGYLILSDKPGLGVFPRKG
jgi:L-alanine-DL-glutamate epimerase-like enolase superfamily enzyme